MGLTSLIQFLRITLYCKTLICIETSLHLHFFPDHCTARLQGGWSKRREQVVVTFFIIVATMMKLQVDTSGHMGLLLSFLSSIILAMMTLSQWSAGRGGRWRTQWSEFMRGGHTSPATSPLYLSRHKNNIFATFSSTRPNKKLANRIGWKRWTSFVRQARRLAQTSKRVHRALSGLWPSWHTSPQAVISKWKLCLPLPWAKYTQGTFYPYVWGVSRTKTCIEWYTGIAFYFIVLHGIAWYSMGSNVLHGVLWCCMARRRTTAQCI